MAARGRRPPETTPAGGPQDLAARRLMPVDSAALGELSAKVDRLVVTVESLASRPTERAPADDLRTEIHGAVAEMAHELQASFHGLIQRLAEETVNLRGGLQTALDEAQRREAQGQEALRAAVNEAVGEVLARQAEDRETARAQLEAGLADTRDQLRTELKAAVSQLGDQRADSELQLRAAFGATLGEQKLRAELVELTGAVEALQAAVTASGDDTRRHLLADFDTALTRRDQALGALLAEESQAVEARMRSALDDVVRQQAQAWEARRAELEAALADGNDQLQQALAEETARLRALEASLLGQAAQSRMQWRADLEAALTAGRDVAVALVTQATDRLVELGGQVAESLTREGEARLREQTEQVHDMQAAFEDLTAAIGLERRELRTAIEAGLDTAELVQRLDALSAATAQGAAEVAGALDKLRRQPRPEARVGDMLMELYDELERLRRRVPAKSDLRLADDQVAAIIEAVGSARPGAGRSPAKAAGRTAAPQPAAPAKRATARRPGEAKKVAPAKRAPAPGRGRGR